MPRHFIKRRRRAIPPRCLPVPQSPEPETSEEINTPMQKLLSLLQSMSHHFSIFGRNSMRRIFKPRLLAIVVAIGYVMLQPAERAAFWTNFKTALLGIGADHRLEEKSRLQAE